MDNQEQFARQIEELNLLKKCYTSIFGGDDGKKVMDDLRKKCWERKVTFASDALLMAFREGQRSIMLHILNMQEIDVEKIKQQIGDNQNV